MQAERLAIDEQLWLAVAIVAISAIGFSLQWYVPQVTDVSWLFLIVERIFSGERLYVDILETNPPMSVLLYMPTVKLARWLGLTPEFLQIWLTMLLAAVAVWWSSGILWASGQIVHLARYRVLALAATVVLPLGCYSEREHFALLVTLPALAILVARLQGGEVRWQAAVLAGLGEGLAVTIKPQMALPILLAVGYGVIWSRSLRLMVRPEHCVGLVVVAAYLVVVVKLFPDYFAIMLPILMETYRAVRYSLLDMLIGDGSLAVIAMVISLWLLVGQRLREPRLAVPVLASIGYWGSYLEQSKGWAYHLYPAVGLLSLTLANEAIALAYAATTETLRGRLHLTGTIAVILGMVVGSVPVGEWLEGRQWDSFPLATEIRRLSPNPTISIVSDDLGLTNPLIRMVNGRFVGRLASQWITNYARYRIQHEDLSPEGVERMKAWIDYDREVLAEDVRKGRPEFIVIDRGGFDWLDWARQSPELAALIADYRQAGRASDIYLLARADIAPDAPHPSTGRFWRLGGSDRWKGLDRDEAAVHGIRWANR